MPEITQHSIPVAVRNNGAHEYYEDGQRIVLRNHGESFWSAHRKGTNGSIGYVTSDPDPVALWNHPSFA